MNQTEFEARHEQLWQSFALWLENEGKTRRARAQSPQPFDAAQLPRIYRQICQHLALARDRCYTPGLVERLNALVLEGHNRFYSGGVIMRPAALRFLLGGFARQVRAEWRIVMLAAALFWLPGIAAGVAVQYFPEFVYTMIPAPQVKTIGEMYSPKSRHYGRPRAAETDLDTFAFYIWNNTGIGFRTFAGGILFGLGSIFFLVFNGLMIGTVAGHLTHVGYITSYWGFVAGHSGAELTAIVLSGAAGLILGRALLIPGHLSRTEALRLGAQAAVRLMYGAAVLFFIAAFIEAFWSSSVLVPHQIKYAVGIVLWALLLAYFWRAGRSRGA